MTFSQVKGNEVLCSTLAKMVDSGQLPHAILFHEEDAGGALPLCLAFLQYLYCDSKLAGAYDSCNTCSSCTRISRLIHPDVHLIVPTIAKELTESYMPQIRELVAQKASFSEAELASALKIEGKSSVIAVSEAKRLLEKLSLTALEGGYRSIIIYLPEKMNIDAANKLLKMIEEPPALTQFLLITHRPEKVLQTIASRCQRIRVLPSSASISLPDFEQPELFYELMNLLLAKDLLGSLDLAEKLASLSSREQAMQFCAFAAACLRQIFLAQQGLGSLAVQDGLEQMTKLASACPKTFPRKALAALDRASILISRNVNLKILFTDLVDRLYILL